MRENEKERELLKASRPKTLLMIKKKKSLGYSAAWDLNTTQSHTKLQKSMKESLLHEGQLRKNEKCNKKVKKSKGCRNRFAALRNFAGVEKFRNPCEIAKVHSFHYAALFF